MKFRTLLDHDLRTPAPEGKPTKDEFQLKIEPDGSRRLVKCGVRQLYEEIQSFKAETDINRIVTRALGGDLTALQASPGAYIDATQLPQDLHEAHQVLQQAEEAYLSIPEKERLEFGTFSEFLAQFETPAKISDLLSKFAKIGAEAQADRAVAQAANSANSTTGGDQV